MGDEQENYDEKHDGADAGVVPSVFQQAIEQYISEIAKKSKSKKRDFIVDIMMHNDAPTEKDVQESMKKLQSKYSNEARRKKTARVLDPLVKGFKDYYDIIDTFVQAYPMPTALIWGGLKIIIELGARFITLIEMISEELKQITEQINRLVDLEEMYREFAPVQRILCASYINILRFLCEVNKQCRKNALQQLVSSSFSHTKIAKIVVDLKKNADQVDRTFVIAENQLNAGARRDARFEAVKAECERIAAQEERMFQAKWRQEDSDHKDRILRTELRRWLQGNNANNRGVYKKLLQKCHKGSGQWLLENPTFCSWLNDELEQPTLWLHAPPGAGKSVLCAFIITILQSSMFNRITAFIFIKDGDPVSDIQNLRNLAEQLLLKYYEMHTGIPLALISLLDKDSSDASHVKSLILFLVKELKGVYIFIDGLDEAPDAGQWDDTLEFLQMLTEESSGMTRIWVSSQNTAAARSRLKLFREFDGCRHHMSLDIEAYINATMPNCFAESEEDSVSRIHKIVRERAKDNFLWATQMIELLRKADSEGERLSMALDGLPESTDQYYQSIMERIRKEDATRNNIVSLMLSIITFARRPLTLAELREAIATCRSEENSNFDKNYLPYPQRLLDRCAPLVEFIHTPDAPYDGVFQLTHSVVRVFLTKQADFELESSNSTIAIAPFRDIPKASFISKTTLAECCLRYLSQPKYSQLLHKKTPCRFETSGDGDVDGHFLLIYAAKYWDKQFDDMIPSKESCEKISRFVKSTNFQTCIQIQASFVIGHFIQSHNSSGKGVFAKRFLPNWLEHECGKNFAKIRSDYLTFVSEWGELLQKGIGTPFRGEIDRCFWSALGPGNFLHANFERYTSFMLMQPTNMNHLENVAYVEAMSPDLSKLTLFSFPLLTETTASINIRQETWNLNKDQCPSCNQIVEYAIPKPDNLKHYSTYSSRKFLVNPEISSQYRPSYADITVNQDIVRLGSMLFRTISDEKGRSFVPIPEVGGVSATYWEEIASRGSFIAVARRRKPREIKTTQLARHLKKFIRIRHSSGNDTSDDSDVEETEGSASSISSTSDFEGSQISSDDLEDISSPEEAWSDSDVSSRSGSGSESGESEGSLEIDSEVESNDINSNLESLDDIDDYSIHSAGSDNPEWLPRIINGSGGLTFSCDVCSSVIVDTTHYHCEICNDDRFDICKSCLESGKWCLNNRHQLIYETNAQETLDIISLDDLSPGRDLIILQMKPNTASVLFHSHGRTSRVLYESPPVFHPSLPLLVWPTGEGLLFVDFSRNSCFEQKLFTSSKKACHVSVQLYFSDCGKYLHTLSIEVTKPEDAKSTKKSFYKPQLSVHLFTFQLSASKPSTSPPKTIFRTSINLGQCISPILTQVPVSVTWAGREAYVIIGYTQLVLYKVVLFKNPDDPSSRNIFVPGKPIFLPRSAKDRRMRFFPAILRGRDCSKALLLISGCSGEMSARPTGVYLSEEEDLGGWTALSDSLRLMDDLRTKQRLEGKFENFDQVDDCDLMPFSMRERG